MYLWLVALILDSADMDHFINTQNSIGQCFQKAKAGEFEGRKHSCNGKNDVAKQNAMIVL